MPRVSREQTEKHREAIEKASMRLFRERGLHGVSVAELMATAGLTHGGFYGHFESKDELAAQVCARSLEQGVRHWQEIARTNPDAALGAIFAHYLSTSQRDHPGRSCTAATLGADVAREPRDKPVHQAYIAGIKGLAEVLAALSGLTTLESRQQQALTQLATLVGAQFLARATRSDPISDDILAAAYRSLLQAGTGNETLSATTG